MPEVTDAPESGPAFELHALPLERSEADAPDRRRGLATRVLLHRAPGATRNLAIYVQSGFTGMPLTGRHDYRPLAIALDRPGCSLLVLQSSAARRTAYVPFDTCVNDIRSCIGWAKARGFDNMALIGVSMGNARVAYWNAVAPDPAVKAMVFVATVDSIALGHAAKWTPEERALQDDVLQRCRDLIAAGRESELVVGELANTPFPMTAEAYLSYFGRLDEMNASSLKHAHAVTTPILLIHGTEDMVCTPQGAQAVFDALGSAPQKELVWIDGGLHQLLSPGWSANIVSSRIADFVAANL